MCLISCMPVLKNPKHEAFAQAVAGGMEAGKAYRKVYKSKAKTAETSGPRLFRNVAVKARVRELQEETSKTIAFTKQEALEFLADVIRTPIGDIDETSPLCQEYTVDEINSGGGQGKLRRGNAPEGNERRGDSILRTKLKMPSKLDALKQMAQLCGWNEPEKHDVAVTGPRGVLAGILNRKS